MKFSELDSNKIFNLVCNNNKLKEEFDNYVYDCEINGYVMDKISVIKDSLNTYSIGTYNQNYIIVGDYSCFVYRVRECVDIFGCSENLEKLLTRCEKLTESNLFEYYAKKLKGVFFDEEIQHSVEWVENLDFAIYSKDFDELKKLDGEDLLCLWAECMDDFLKVDEEGKVYHVDIYEYN